MSSTECVLIEFVLYRGSWVRVASCVLCRMRALQNAFSVLVLKVFFPLEGDAGFEWGHVPVRTPLLLLVRGAQRRKRKKKRRGCHLAATRLPNENTNANTLSNRGGGGGGMEGGEWAHEYECVFVGWLVFC